MERLESRSTGSKEVKRLRFLIFQRNHQQINSDSWPGLQQLFYQRGGKHWQLYNVHFLKLVVPLLGIENPISFAFRISNSRLTSHHSLGTKEG
jgi:hypothetical protein